MVSYAGGTKESPTYEQVCSGRTGHAEAVHITYDPRETTFNELLNVFFENHDPTTLNQQGPDIGAQYRSAIFYVNDEQKQAIEEKIKELNEKKRFSRPIVTEVTPAGTFWKAEEYHQRYVEKHGSSVCPT